MPSTARNCPSIPPRSIPTALALITAASLYLSVTMSARAHEVDSCFGHGRWAVPTPHGATAASPNDVVNAARDARFVLLGEVHDNADHHLWQLQALAMLLGQRGSLVIGMEMFPRRVQPALDRWIAGELTEAQFLEESDWNQVWRLDPELYMPIMRFARLNHIPLVALNVERSLIADTAKQGWSAIEASRREGISDPAPATQPYRELLRSSFEQHGEWDESDFDSFVQAQLVWDRAFAQALTEAQAKRPGALVVGIIGSGHLRYFHGVPHQLSAMGESPVSVWLPVPYHGDCAKLANVADAVFAVSPGSRSTPPKLGVYLSDTDAGTEISKIVHGSVAEAAGLVAGDRIVSAAGVPISGSADVIAIVRRQSPGTWLPLTVARDGETIDIVARFPTTAKTRHHRHSNPDE